MVIPKVLHFGRDTCGNLPIAQRREWLVSNGIGGYGSGTVAGLLTRHYHGLLVAALEPPLGRTLMLVKLDETAQYEGQSFELGCNRWQDGSVSPTGYVYLEAFELEGTIPVWHYALADARLSKRVWMEQGQNTTYVRYSLSRGTTPLQLHLRAFLNYRDHHGGSVMGNWQIWRVEEGIDMVAFGGAVPLRLRGPGNWTLNNEWYRHFDLQLERYRGTGYSENHFQGATLEMSLEPGQSLTFVVSAQSDCDQDGEAALQRQRRYESQLYDRALGTLGDDERLQQLALAADQFICDRPLSDGTPGQTIMAGYPWFGDWGRDTAISLPGLTLATGRPEIARTILRTFARYFDQGMMPNLFPDSGMEPDYNTVDAILWYFQGVQAYFEGTEDINLIEELYPALQEVIDWHLRGTRYNIRVDEDGLLYAGEAGVQLTWMDAKIDDWVVTPRQGKAVEINALWYNALGVMVRLAQALGKDETEYQQLAQRTRQGFSRFWYEAGGYCYDVLDSPQGDDASLRPNQIFALSLPESLLTKGQGRSLLAVVGRELLTSYGLRSLSRRDPQYCGQYGGDRWQRDGAYHQGTVWSWLLGPFALAHYKIYGDKALARSFVDPLFDHLQDGAVGSISEIFDGNPPHTPRGCFAQAWSVAELLRVMSHLRD
ncbi:MAG: glycogen debranching protein [Phormidium sp. GEM2.Bin31]|nr:glycogen debranching enzyme family protein [Phormidium sp. BM_Day4_Bin.17]TVR03965.1 MAG: glycogen debranching protein [Phormidium sp. GEM2.Bin31]UCJ10995.1 MAG: glycogen debranching enzyme N-terminal domain-containing protein [Phormidium sp. PBR-2020]